VVNKIREITVNLDETYFNYIIIYTKSLQLYICQKFEAIKFFCFLMCNVCSLTKWDTCTFIYICTCICNYR